MSKHAVPDVGSKVKVSIPMPDLLYGYNRLGAFTRSMGMEMVANSNGLVYPFFVIEFKADGPSGSGSLWVATNQCLGGSTSGYVIGELLEVRAHVDIVLSQVILSVKWVLNKLLSA
jgi:hypothetical protein